MNQRWVFERHFCPGRWEFAQRKLEFEVLGGGGLPGGVFPGEIWKFRIGTSWASSTGQFETSTLFTTTTLLAASRPNSLFVKL